MAGETLARLTFEEVDLFRSEGRRKRLTCAHDEIARDARDELRSTCETEEQVLLGTERLDDVDDDRYPLADGREHDVFGSNAEDRSAARTVEPPRCER